MTKIILYYLIIVFWVSGCTMQNSKYTNTSKKVVVKIIEGKEVRFETNYLFDNSVDSSQCIFADNILYRKASWKDGLLTDTLFEYYSNGEVKTSKPYLMGKLDGILINYYEDGSILQKVEYKNGVLDGIYNFYDREGNVDSHAQYKNGKMISRKSYEK